MRLRDACALGEPDHGNRGAGLLVPPQHFFGNALQRFFSPRPRGGIDQDFFELRRAFGHLAHAFPLHTGSCWKSVENECIRRAPVAVSSTVSANTQPVLPSFHLGSNKSMLKANTIPGSKRSPTTLMASRSAAMA